MATENVNVKIKASFDSTGVSQGTKSAADSFAAIKRQAKEAQEQLDKLVSSFESLGRGGDSKGGNSTKKLSDDVTDLGAGVELSTGAVKTFNANIKTLTTSLSSVDTAVVTTSENVQSLGAAFESLSSSGIERFASSAKELNTSLTSVKSAFDNVGSGGGEAGSTFKDFATAISGLKGSGSDIEALSKLFESLGSLKTGSLDKFATAFERFATATDRMDRESKQVILAFAKYNIEAKKLDKTLAKTSKSSDKMAADLKQFSGESRKAAKGSKQFAKNLEDVNRRIGGPGGFKQALLNLNLGLSIFTKTVSTLSTIGNFFSRITDNILAADQSIASFTSTLEEVQSATGSTNAETERLGSFIKRLAQDANASEGAVAKIIRASVAFGASQQQAAKAAVVSINLSRKLGITLEDAGKKVSDTFKGTAEELNTIGYGTERMTADMLKSGAAVDLLADKLGLTVVPLERAGERIDDMINQWDVFTENLTNAVVNTKEFHDLLDTIKRGLNAITGEVEEVNGLWRVGIQLLDQFIQSLRYIVYAVASALLPKILVLISRLRIILKVLAAALSSVNIIVGVLAFAGLATLDWYYSQEDVRNSLEESAELVRGLSEIGNIDLFKQGNNEFDIKIADRGELRDQIQNLLDNFSDDFSAQYEELRAAAATGDADAVKAFHEMNQKLADVVNKLSPESLISKPVKEIFERFGLDKYLRDYNSDLSRAIAGLSDVKPKDRSAEAKPSELPKLQEKYVDAILKNTEASKDVAAKLFEFSGSIDGILLAGVPGGLGNVADKLSPSYRFLKDIATNTAFIPKGFGSSFAAGRRDPRREAFENSLVAKLESLILPPSVLSGKEAGDAAAKRSRDLLKAIRKQDQTMKDVFSNFAVSSARRLAGFLSDDVEKDFSQIAKDIRASNDEARFFAKGRGLLTTGSSEIPLPKEAQRPKFENKNLEYLASKVESFFGFFRQGTLEEFASGLSNVLSDSVNALNVAPKTKSSSGQAGGRDLTNLDLTGSVSIKDLAGKDPVQVIKDIVKAQEGPDALKNPRSLASLYKALTLTAGRIVTFSAEIKQQENKIKQIRFNVFNKNLLKFFEILKTPGATVKDLELAFKESEREVKARVRRETKVLDKLTAKRANAETLYKQQLGELTERQKKYADRLNEITEATKNLGEKQEKDSENFSKALTAVYQPLKDFGKVVKEFVIVYGGQIAEAAKNMTTPLKLIEESLKDFDKELKRTNRKVARENDKLDRRDNPLDEKRVAFRNIEAQFGAEGPTKEADKLDYEKLKKAYEDALNEQVSTAQGVLSTEEGKLDSALELQFDLVDKLEDLAETNAEKAEDFIFNSVDKVLETVGQLLPKTAPVTDALRGLFALLDLEEEQLNYFLQAITDAVPKFIDKIDKRLGPLFKSLAQAIIQLTPLINKVIIFFVVELIKHIPELVNSTLEAIGVTIYNFFVDVINAIGIFGEYEKKELFNRVTDDELLAKIAAESDKRAQAAQKDVDAAQARLDAYKEELNSLKKSGSKGSGGKLPQITFENPDAVREGYLDAARAYNPYDERRSEEHQPIIIRVDLGNQTVVDLFTDLSEAGRIINIVKA